jgi:putative hydrolase of the HAD superfamily
MTWLICDYGEVLSLPPPADDRAALETAAGWPETSETFWNSYWIQRRSYDRGDVSASEYWEAVLARSVTNAELSRLIGADVAGWLHPNLRSVEAIGSLRDRGVQLALFSNAPVEVAAGIAAAPWMEPFSRMFFSCDLRAVKPEPAAYRAVLDGLHVTARDVVFVDDRPENVTGAAAMGIRSVLFEGADQLAAVV